MELFDTAMIVDEPFLAPARIDLTALRAHAVAVPVDAPPSASDSSQRRLMPSGRRLRGRCKVESALAHRRTGPPEAEQHAVC
ncbi:hypothetical protein ABLN69_10890 [Mycobacterium tuberculosis]|uniref:hypothetical protein n=1 Tax=Mycobacterium tuberculosis TaxID=1773 RepID=UPI0032B3D840